MSMSNIDRQRVRVDLLDIIGHDIVHVTYCHSSPRYYEWETYVAVVLLLEKGYELSSSFFTIEEDSFGVLVRAVRLTKDGIEYLASYG